MSTHSRRSFLATSAGLAAGATFVATQRGAAASDAPTASADPSTPPNPEPPMNVDALGGAVMYIRDASAGTIVVMDADGEHTIVDPSLVHSIARAAGTKG